MQKLVEMTGSLEKLTGVEEEEESGSSIHGSEKCSKASKHKKCILEKKVFAAIGVWE